MFKNYLLVTSRNLFKNKVFTIINILGLGVALSVCIVAFFNHMFNYEFDRTHKNFSSIYRVTSFRDMKGREQEYGLIPATLGLVVKKDIPGIEKASRIMRTGSPVKVGNDLFPSTVCYADPEFVDIFTFPLISGDIKSISSQANVLVSKKMAEKMFGRENPLGKTITIINDAGKSFAYTIGAVFDDLPENSSFRIDVLSHFDNFLLMWGANDTDWKLWANVLFIQVKDKSIIPSVSQSLKQYLPVQNKAREDFIINRFNIIPLKDVGKKTRTIWSSALFPSLHPAALIAPSVMALFILLIACFNFANTSRSIFSRRLKEIGLRKTFGGQKRQLVTQFMIETFIICGLALLVGLIIAEFLVPAYSNLWNYMSIELTFTKYAFFWFFMVLLVLITGFIAGIFPALYVSSFSPVNVIKGDSAVKGTGKLSIVLLTLQFSISVMSIVLGVVFAKNAEYQRTLDLGFDRDKLIVVPVPIAASASMRNEILSNSKVISAEGTNNHIGWGSYRRPIKDVDKRLEVDVLDIGPGYAQTMGLRLVEGRLFDRTREGADRSDNSVIVNQRFVQDLGWKTAVGKFVTLYDTTKLNIIGVVKDFYTYGVWQKLEPAMLRLAGPDRLGIIAVRANPADLAEVLEFIAQRWKTLIPESIFTGRLQEDLMQEEKDINGSILKVNVFLSITATLLSLIGMYNMVLLDIIKRTKEIGIRKIQGAPLHVLIYLMSRKFLLVLAIASLLGCFGGYKVSIMLMDSIWDYFTPVGIGILVLSAAIMFFATIFTIIFRITKASMINPVVSLRYE